MRTLLAGLLTVAATAALADFDLDLDQAAARRAAGKFVLSDLAVGEVGMISAAALFCREGRDLYLWDLGWLDEEIYSYGFKVRREPDGRVSMVVHLDKSEKSEKQIALEKIASAGECSETKIGDNRLRVISINGAESASELLALPD